MKKTQLLAPAGSMESLAAAINNGADAAFFGIGKANMRRNVKGFSEDKYFEGMERLHDAGMEGYLTLNTIYYNREKDEISRMLDLAEQGKSDAVICWDPMIMQACKERGLPIHISTQASIANSASAQFYKDLGAKCIVLARECTLKDVVEIKKDVDIEIETFIHGAMCVAVSGRCFMSQFTTGHSANRGDCKQPCRYPYQTVKGTNHDIELTLTKSTVMSPKDLCAMPMLDKLLMAGIDKLKIEGRARGPEYVAASVKAYRQAIDAFYAGTLDQKLLDKLTEDLKGVFNREFSNGFYFGQPMDAWAEDGNMATKKKEHLGKVLKVYPKINVIEVQLQTGDLALGEELVIIGERCGAYSLIADSIQIEHESREKAFKGEAIGMKVKDASDLRANDQVYRITSIFQ